MFVQLYGEALRWWMKSTRREVYSAGRPMREGRGQSGKGVSTLSIGSVHFPFSLILHDIRRETLYTTYSAVAAEILKANAGTRMHRSCGNSPRHTCATVRNPCLSRCNTVEFVLHAELKKRHAAVYQGEVLLDRSEISSVRFCE